MAGRAGVRRYCGVVEARRCPGHGGVTALARGGRGQVAGGLALRDQAVVTARAASKNLGVVDTYDRQPGERRVASLARVARRDMSRGLAAAAGRGMAGYAELSGHAGVAERCRRD